tara:strand:+ start:529 stop:876 length:348 start_codon:yes stop_codon:yes gene_type:complete
MEIKKQLISLTEAAADHAKILMSRSERPVLGLRVGVSTRGCNGLSYVVDFVEHENNLEEMTEDKGVKIYVDPMAIMYVLGSTMDYVEDKFHSGFVFENPNETSRCGCGESFSVSI